MPVVETLMASLVKRYGAAEGERVYYAMEASGRGPFGPGGKYHDLHLAFAKKHGVKPLFGGKKKPPASSKKRGAKAKATPKAKRR